MKIGSLRIKVHLPFIFFSAHPILHEMVKDICSGLYGEDFKKSKPVFVFCGAHKKFAFASVLKGKKLFIQTEQLCSEGGKSLWGSKKNDVVQNIIKNIRQSDVFLDINLNNRAFYETVGLNELDRSKIDFGPHIFPRKMVDYKEGTRNSVCFFGSLNERRDELIRQFSSKSGLHVEVVPEKTYGASLKRVVSASASVLNIHYEDAIYTEAPRLLAVYLHGKVVFSEIISKPFQENVHYIGLGFQGDIEHSQVFKNFVLLVSQEFSFAKYIKRRILNKED